MQTPKGKTATADALVGLWAVALTSFVIATLYFARDFLIPLALAALLTFLLSPLVTRIERWLGRITAVLLVGVLILAATGAAGWMLTRQLVDLAAKLPDYKENIHTKVRSIKVPTGGVFKKFSDTVEELKKDLPGAETSTDVQGDVWDRRCKEVAIAGFVLAVILKLPTPELTDFALIIQPILAVAAYWVANWE